MIRAILFFTLTFLLSISTFTWAAPQTQPAKPKIESPQSQKTEKDEEEGKAEEKDDRLIEASAEGDLEEVKDLLKEGAKINEMDETEGQTALIAAAKFGRVEVVRTLLKAHASVDLGDELNGATALMWICSNETEEGNPYKPPVSDKVQIMQLLLQNGAKVNTQNTWGGTALQWACDAGTVELVQGLLKAGAKPDLADHDGLSPLMAAANYEGANFLQIVQLLIQSKATVNQTNKAGDTALHFASGNNFKPDNVLALLKSGAKVDAMNNLGETPLMKACQTARVEIAKALVANGANIHAVNKEGLNVWRVANRAGYKEMIAFLSSLGLKD